MCQIPVLYACVKEQRSYGPYTNMQTNGQTVRQSDSYKTLLHLDCTYIVKTVKSGAMWPGNVQYFMVSPRREGGSCLVMIWPSDAEHPPKYHFFAPEWKEKKE